MSNTLDFYGPNAGYALELYERYLKDPGSVDPESRALFDGGLVPPPPAVSRRPASAPVPTRAPEGRPTPPVAAVPPPASVPAPASASPLADGVLLNKVVAAARLARIVRELGHLNARLDPLGSDPPGDPSLELSAHGLTVEDLEALPASVIGGPCAEDAQNAAEALGRLRRP